MRRALPVRGELVCTSCRFGSCCACEPEEQSSRPIAPSINVSAAMRVLLSRFALGELSFISKPLMAGKAQWSKSGFAAAPCGKALPYRRNEFEFHSRLRLESEA